MAAPHHSIKEWDEQVNVIARCYLEEEIGVDKIAARLTRSGFATKGSSVKRNLARWGISRRLDYVKVIAQCYLYLQKQGHDPTFTRYDEQVPREEINTYLREHPQLQTASDARLPGHIRHSITSSLTADIDHDAETRRSSDDSAGVEASPAKRKRTDEAPSQEVRFVGDAHRSRRVASRPIPQLSDSESDEDDSHQSNRDRDDADAQKVKQLKKTLKEIEALFSKLTLSDSISRESMDNLKAAVEAELSEIKNRGVPEETDYGPLHVLIRFGQIDLVRMLLQRGADVNARGGPGLTALHVAALYGQFDILSLLLLEKGIDINAVSNYGHTALHLAVASSNHSNCALLLIRSGANVDIVDKHGDTALHDACRQKTLWEVVQKLAEKSCNLNLKNKKGLTPLHIAAALSFAEDYVRTLIAAGANMNVQDSNGRTPMHQACFEGSEELLTYMTSQDVDLTIKGDKHETILHLLCQRDLCSVAKIVASTPGVDINAKSKRDVTPLFLAAASNSLRTVQMLVEKNADTTLINVDAESALMAAIKAEHYQIAAYLIEHTSSPLNPQNMSPKRYKAKADANRKAEQALSAPTLADMSRRSIPQRLNATAAQGSGPSHINLDIPRSPQHTQQMIPTMIDYLMREGFNVSKTANTTNANLSSSIGRKQTPLQDMDDLMMAEFDNFSTLQTMFPPDLDFATSGGSDINAYFGQGM